MKKEHLLIKRRLDSIRGKIISSASRIEFILGYRLRKYFFPRTNNKATILFWNVINTPLLNFDNKISLYEQIPYFKKLKSYLQIKKSLRFIQKLRNIMAHWEIDEQKSNLQNIIMFTLVGRYRTIKINQNLIKDFDKSVNFLLKKFGYSR